MGGQGFDGGDEVAMSGPPTREHPAEVDIMSTPGGYLWCAILAIFDDKKISFDSIILLNFI